MRFVLAFLATALIFLLGYRYASDTVFMDGYLYGIAAQTALVLDVLPGSGFVEDASLYAGKEGEVRARVAAWTAQPVKEDAGPLSAWEAWRYRALKSRQERALARREVAVLAAGEEHASRAPEADQRYLRERLESVERLLQTRSAGSKDGLNEIQIRTQLQHYHASLRALERMPAQARDAQQERLSSVQKGLDDLQKGLASDARKRLHALEAQARSDGPRVTYKHGDRAFRFRVVPDCGAVPSIGVFAAAVLAFPVSWRRRAVGLLAGIPVLYAINVLRLACLALLGAWIGDGPSLDFYHQYVWQGVYVAFVVAVWLVWVELIVRRARRCRVAPQ